MKAIFTLTNTAYKHITGSNISDMREIQNIKVLKNEEFGLQLLIESDEEFSGWLQRLERMLNLN